MVAGFLSRWLDFGMTRPIDRDAGAAVAGLFEDLPEPSEAQVQQVQQGQARIAERRRQGAPRLREPNRLQVELRASDLKSLLAQDHCARLVWGYVERSGPEPVDRGGQGAGQQCRSGGDRPAYPVCTVALRHARGGGQRARSGAALSGARRVSVDLWRGVGEPPRPQRLSRRQRSADG